MNLTRIIDLKERIAIGGNVRITREESDFILECISIAVASQRAVPTVEVPTAAAAFDVLRAIGRHTLVGNAVHMIDKGIMACCSCGWMSGGHFSSMAASAAFREHQEQAAKP